MKRWLKKVDRFDVLIAIGLLGVGVGTSLAWRPLGLIVVGIYLMWNGVSGAQTQKGRGG